MTIKIGDSLWYRPGYNADRYKWFEVKIDGETKQSWLFNAGQWNEGRVNKKTLYQSASDLGQRGYGGRSFFTDAQKHDREWAEANRRAIVTYVETCPVEELRKIAALIGHHK